MRLTLLIALALTTQLLFGQSKNDVLLPQVLSMSYPEFISACDIPNHKKQLVYTRFVYSGAEEYWGLSPDKKCDQNININADLNIPDNLEVSAKHLKLLKNVHENYWKKYLIIDVVGTYEEGKYGHLGSNNSRFTVKKIIDIYILDKKQTRTKNK